VISFSALQYGLSGLSAVLFDITVGILQTEQKRKQVRPEILATLRVVMGFAVFMMLVPAGVGAFRLLPRIC
jgi:hypothetical protein